MSILDLAHQHMLDCCEAAGESERRHSMPVRGWKSRSVGVHSSRVKSANENLKKRGVTTHYYAQDGSLTADGQQSNRSLRRALKKINPGLVNLDDNS